MSRFGGLSEERPSVFKTRSKLGTHFYRPNVAGMKGRVDLAQPVNRTPDLWCGSTIHYHSILFASAVPTQEKFIEENVRIKNAIAAAVPTQEKFIQENVRIKNAIEAAVPTQEKFIEENVHIEVQKIIHQQFQQTRLPFNRHSWTPGHGLLVHGLLVTNGCPRLEGRKTRKTMSGAS
ncbi:hypothetical protein TNCV_4964781 [Trichonephila clavipes]|nr:hypothetical protein TNCV_4964781 [Trichonephila clavipes]